MTHLDLLLPEGTNLLHIGPQKTGTTALQMALHRRRKELREHGVVVPGTGTRPRLAVWSRLGAPEGIKQPKIHHWHKLVREVEEAADHRVCISTEDWARTDLDGAKAVVDGLGGDRPHVVVTARRLDRLLPSQWQQRVKMRAISLTYEEWLEKVLGDDTDDAAWRNLWVPHDIESVVDRWSEAAGGRDRVTLIVANESDHGLLPKTFERMLDLPVGMLGAAESDKRNSTVSLGRIEVIRRVNELANSEDWPEPFTTGHVRLRLTDRLKSAAPWPNELKSPPLPQWAADRVKELSDQRADLVHSLDVRVVGEPDNLRMPPPSGAEPEAPETIMVSAALAARGIEEVIERTLEVWVDEQARHERQVARLRTKLKKARARRKRARKAARGRGRQVDTMSSRELLGELRRRALRRLPGRG